MKPEFVYTKVKEHFRLEELSKSNSVLIGKLINKELQFIEEAKRDRKGLATSQAFADSILLGKRSYQ